MTVAPNTTDTATRFADSIAALPPLPVTAQRILTCFGDEFIDAKKVAEVVEGDPGICAKLLGLANSAYFGLAQPVNSISEAISRVLGVDTVRSLVLAMAIQQTFKSQDCPTFDVERFWVQSLTAAECCKRIVAVDRAANDDDRDLAYSAGLCHNLGLMALAFREPARTNSVLSRHRDHEQSAILAPMFVEEFGTDHKIVTAELARKWSLPESMVTAYQYRAFPNSHCDGRLGFIVAAGVVVAGNADVEEDQRVCVSMWSDSLGIDARDLGDMADFGERQRERVQSLAGNMTR